MIGRALVLLVLAVAAHALPPPESEVPPLHLGAVGYVKGDTRGSIAPLVTYLERGLDRKIKLTMYPSYNEAIVQIAGGGIDLAILPPIVQLQANDALETRTLGYGVYNSGQFSYRAVILTRKGETAIKSVKDLAGKKIGFVDLFSASGYVYPKLMLAEAGVDPKSVTDVFLRNHLDAIKALDSGQVDAAATYEFVFVEAKTAHKKLEDYTTLAWSEPIPSEALVATPKLDEKIAQKVQDLLLAFYAKRKGDPALAGGMYMAFIPPDPAILVGIRDAYHKVVPKEESK